MDLEEARRLTREFSAERDWLGFHTPKNLVLALTGEVGELAEVFQWMTTEEAAAVATDERLATRAGEEMADVLAYLVMLADALDLDLGAAFTRKMALNAAKYPVEASRESSAEQDQLGPPG